MTDTTPASGSKPARSPRHRHSPFVRRALAQRGIPPSVVRATGPGGRITRRDVLAHLAEADRTPVDHPAAAVGLVAVDVDIGRIERLGGEPPAGEPAAGGPAADRPPLVAIVTRALADGLGRLVAGRTPVDVAVNDAREPGVVRVVRAVDELRLGAIAARLAVTAPAPDDGARCECCVVDASGLAVTLAAATDPGPYSVVLTVGPSLRRAVAVSVDGELGVALRPVVTLTLALDTGRVDARTGAELLAEVKRSLETTDWSSEL